MNDLTSSETELLIRLEKIIDAGKRTFVTVGNALADIRDKRLYRKDHKTFEVYCYMRWGWTPRRANQMVEAASVVQALPKEMGTMVPNERTARALVKVPPESRVSVLKSASKNGPVTAIAITKAIKLDVVERKDHIGRVIPKEILEDWARANQVATDLRRCAQEIKLRLQAGLEDDDIIFREMANPDIAEAEGIYYRLSHILPYAVCPQCQGRVRKNCQQCKERGWISKPYYDSFIDKKTKAVLQASISK